MKNIMDEGKKTIKDIKQELLVLEEYKEKSRNALNLEMKYEKELHQKQKDMEDEISSTTRKRRSDIENTYDSQINKNKAQVKKVIARREKSKNSKMSERIKDETAQLVSENRLVKADIKSVMYKEKIPLLCGSGYYFSIFRPKTPADAFVILVTLVVLLFILPFGIFFISPWDEGIFLKVLTYVLIILLFGGLYIMVSNTFNSWHDKALAEVYGKKCRINDNKKEIRRIIKRIKKDKDESIYNLDKYDKEIDEINHSVDDLVKQKKSALETFENSTKHIIETEISNRYEKDLSDIKDNYSKTRKDADRLEDVVNKMTIDFSTKYEPYLGKDFLKVEKLDALTEIINKGEAKTISEAIAVYKSRYAI